MKRLVSLAGVLLLSFSIFITDSAFALSPGDYSLQHIQFYDLGDGCSSTAGVATGAHNTDYLGQTILKPTQMSTIQANQPVYEQAATQVGIPWQMIAVIHLRESNLSPNNPSNGQGIYQDSGATAGEYPAGPVSEADFLKQTIWAANLIKSKS